MSQSRLVCLSPYVPFSGIDHAGGDYVLAYLTAVHAAGWSVTAICPDNPANRSARDNAPPWMHVLLTPRDDPSLARRAARLLRRGVSALPPRPWFRKLDAAAKDALASATVIDLQWMASIQYAPLLRKRYPSIPIVATPHDVKSESIARARRSPRLHVALVAGLSLRSVRRTEVTATAACARVFVFKPEDVEAFKNLGVTAEVRATPPLVRLPSDAPRPDPTSSLLLFPAAFWRDENDEAARWFLEKIWPVIADRVPGARIRFAGARPSAWLQSRRDDRVEVTGYLADFFDAYRGAAAVVAPLQRGAGLKFKVAQAVAIGFPVIGTSVAIEGINELTGRSTLRAHDGADAFADEVVSALANIGPRITEAMTEAEVIRHSLDFEARINEQIHGYADLLGSPPLAGDDGVQHLA